MAPMGRRREHGFARGRQEGDGAVSALDGRHVPEAASGHHDHDQCDGHHKAAGHKVVSLVGQPFGQRSQDAQAVFVVFVIFVVVVAVDLKQFDVFVDQCIESV